MVDFIRFTNDIISSEHITIAKGGLVAAGYANLYGIDDGGLGGALGHVVGWDNTSRAIPKLIAFWNQPNPETFGEAVEKITKSAVWIGAVTNTMKAIMHEIKVTSQVAGLCNNLNKGVGECYKLHEEMEKNLEGNQWMRIAQVTSNVVMRFFAAACDILKLATSVGGQVLNQQALLFASAVAVTARLASYSFEHEFNAARVAV